MPKSFTALIVQLWFVIGGAVAIDLASKFENNAKIRCLILENTFTSIPDVAKTLFNVKLVRILPRWFYKNQYLSRLKVPRITIPVLYLSGTGDQLIPCSMMTELFNATSSESKQLARFPGGSHNETWMCNHYYHTVEYFLDEVTFFSSTIVFKKSGVFDLFELRVGKYRARTA